MNARTRKLYQSLRQTIAVIDAYPEFRAYAAESKAVTLFVNEVDDLEALHHEQEASRRELKDLAARKRGLVDNINITIAGLAATTALLPATTAPLPPFTALSHQLTTLEFTTAAQAIIDNAATLEDVFIDSGLHPQTFDIVRHQLALLVAADCQSAYAEAHARAFPVRFTYAIDRARKRRRQLFLELRRFMTPESRTAWRAAASLGRTHRPKLLAAPAAPKLLAQPTSDEVHEEVGGIKRLARRVGRHLARSEPA